MDGPVSQVDAFPETNISTGKVCSPTMSCRGSGVHASPVGLDNGGRVTVIDLGNAVVLLPINGSARP